MNNAKRFSDLLITQITFHTYSNPFIMNNTELTLDQLKACSGGWYAPFLPIIAKEGAKAIQFYRDAKANYENGDDLDVAILKAGHSSGTIED